MAWYHKLFRLEEKLNPAQSYDLGKIESSREHTVSYERMYEQLEVVNRGVNMIVDDTAEVPAVVSPFDTFPGVVKGVKRAKVDTLLNLSLIHI